MSSSAVIQRLEIQKGRPEPGKAGVFEFPQLNYLRYPNDYSKYMFSGLSSRVVALTNDYTNFHWQIWATFYIWNGVEGSWMLWYIAGGLWYFHNSDEEGCPCLPMDVRSVSVSIQVGSPGNIRNSFGIVKISQSTSDISQLPVSFDACSRRMGLPRSAKGNSYGQSHYSTRQPRKHIFAVIIWKS